jgi:hypothetical protein
MVAHGMDEPEGTESVNPFQCYAVSG